MKKLFTAALAVFTSLAFGATLTPISLLNPSGSTSGQVIASTGPSTAPAWSTVTLSGLPGTVAIANGGTGATTQSAALSNLLGSSAVPVANGGTGATSAAAALTNLGAAPIASPTFTGTPAAPTPGVVANSTTLATTAWVRLLLASPPSWGNTTAAPVFATTLSATGLITPASVIGIKGTSTNDGAQVGSIGEYQPAGPTGAITLTSNTSTNLTSLSLTAGDWDVSGTMDVTPAGTTVVQGQYISISTTSATLGGAGTRTAVNVTHAAGSGDALATPTVRISVAATTTVYLVANVTFSTSTCTATGFIRARRVR